MPSTKWFHFLILHSDLQIWSNSMVYSWLIYTPGPGAECAAPMERGGRRRGRGEGRQWHASCWDYAPALRPGLAGEGPFPPSQLPPSPLVFILFFVLFKINFLFFLFFKCTWKIQNRLNRKKNQISDFTNFYFSSYSYFVTSSPQLSIKFCTISKNINRRILYYSSHSTQHIPHLS